MSSVSGKTILVTGSTDGLGLATARRLASMGASVLVHGRHPQKLERVLVGLPSGQGDGAHCYLADLSSLDETRRLARHVASEHGRLDVLINNAGVVIQERRLSRDGHELTFAINYLSHFLLTLELLPLIESGGGRVVNVASIGQRAIDFDDVMLERDYDPIARLQPEQARPDHVHVRARRAAGPGCGRDRERAPPGDAHGHRRWSAGSAAGS